jgi:two-component sensor histidine kinase
MSESISRAEAYRDPQLRQRIHAVAEFAKDALQDVAFQSLLDHAVIRVSQAIDVQHVKILAYQPETSDLLVVAGKGWAEGVVGHARLSADINSPAGRALQTARPVTVDDFSTNTDLRIPSILAEHTIFSATNVPVMIGSMVWGILEVDSTRPRAFTGDDTDFLNAFAGFLGVAINRKAAEEEGRRAAASQAAAAQQNEILLRELQHRMKNNLQMILSVIMLQRNEAREPKTVQALSQISEHVVAVALAHDQLSSRTALREVAMRPYLKALCAAIERGRKNIVVEANVEEGELMADQAVPVGLIVNEAVTNAIKHAFSEAGGFVRVTFRIDRRSGYASLDIEDDGKGIAPSTPAGAGRRLIEALTSQLGGKMSYTPRSSGTGTTLSVEFPARL